MMMPVVNASIKSKFPQNTITFAVIGAFSGVLSGGFPVWPYLGRSGMQGGQLDFETLYYFPGLSFGLILGLMLVVKRAFKLYGLPIFIALSTAGYFAAFWVALRAASKARGLLVSTGLWQYDISFISVQTTIYSEPGLLSQIMGGFCGGLVGAAILFIPSCLILPAIRSISSCAWLILCGGICGMLYFLPEMLRPGVGIPAFVGIWQMIVAGFLGYLIDKDQAES